MKLNAPHFQRDKLISSGKLLLATHNSGKAREVSHLLRDTPLTLHTLDEFNLPAPAETGNSFTENARIKAEAAGTATNLWVLADDSGLEVAALNNAPGVNTSSYGGWEKLLETMATTPATARDARFLCVLVLRAPDGTLFTFNGTCDGTITEAPSGTGGFGYDPVFRPLGASTTFADMPLETKQTFSHRGKALHAFRNWLDLA